VSTFTYEFEELDLGDGFIVNGSIDVVYKIERDEPDVGFVGGLEYHLTDAVLETSSGDVLELQDSSDLFKRLERALLDKRDDNITDAAKKDHADDRDSGMDDPNF